MIEKQFEIDLQAPLIPNNQFVCAQSHPEMRFWARGNGMILIHEGVLRVRLDNQALCDEVQEKYQRCNAQWFGEVQNLNELQQLLSTYQYDIVNMAPFFIPDKEFKPYHDNEIIFYDNHEIKQFQKNTDFIMPFGYNEADPDILGCSFMIDGQVVALAGLSKNGRYVLEAGIQLLPDYEGCGLATRLLKAITTKAMEDYPEFIVTYGSQCTHTQSLNVAIRSGFKLGWFEYMLMKQGKDTEQ